MWFIIDPSLFRQYAWILDKFFSFFYLFHMNRDDQTINKGYL